MSATQLLVLSVRDRHLLYGTFTGSFAPSISKGIKIYSHCNHGNENDAKENMLLDEQIVHEKGYFYSQGCNLSGKDMDYTWEVRDVATNDLLVSREVHANGTAMTINLGRIELVGNKVNDTLLSSSHIYIFIQILSFFVFYCVVRFYISNYNGGKKNNNNVVPPSIVSPSRPMSESGLIKVVRFNLDDNEVEEATDVSMTESTTLDIFDSESWKFIQN